MNKSESIKEIATALAKARPDYKPIVKDKTAKVQTKSGGSYSFDYADMGTVLDAVTPALNKNGIAILQAARVEGDKVVVETMLTHASGEWMSSELAMKPDDLSPQKVGGAITYARRYALSSMVGVFSEADDDGNHASGNAAETKPKANGHAKPSEVARLEAAKVYVLKLHGGSGSAAKAAIEKCIGRTFGDKPVAGLTEQELANLEAWVELSKAAQNKEREGAQA